MWHHGVLAHCQDSHHCKIKRIHKFPFCAKAIHRRRQDDPKQQYHRWENRSETLESIGLRLQSIVKKLSHAHAAVANTVVGPSHIYEIAQHMRWDRWWRLPKDLSQLRVSDTAVSSGLAGVTAKWNERIGKSATARSCARNALSTAIKLLDEDAQVCLPSLVIPQA
jgi:hypothetical protein